MSDGKSNVKSGLLVSAILAILNYAAGGQTFVNPQWVGSLQKMSGGIPYVGQYLLLLPLELFTVVLSIVAIWGFLTVILSRILGVKNIVLYFAAGIIVLVLITGMNLIDVYNAIMGNFEKLRSPLFYVILACRKNLS